MREDHREVLETHHKSVDFKSLQVMAPVVLHLGPEADPVCFISGLVKKGFYLTFLACEDKERGIQLKGCQDDGLQVRLQNSGSIIEKQKDFRAVLFLNHC